MINHLNEKDKRAFNFIRNTIVHSGHSPSLRDINEFTGGKSPRSASLVVDRLIKAKLLNKVNSKIVLSNNSFNKVSENTINIPLVGNVSCGTPLFAEENIETKIPISTDIVKGNYKYFLLRAVGDSMNLENINDGDLVLVRQQTTAENGDKVVALINDEATIKIFERKDNIIILRPSSKNKKHRPIILSENLIIQGVVISVLPKDLLI